MLRTIGTLAALLLLASAPAGASEENFVRACLSSSNLDRAICECCAQKALQQMSPAALEFLVASLSGDKTRADALSADLSDREVAQAGSFMVRAPRECIQEQGGL